MSSNPRNNKKSNNRKINSNATKELEKKGYTPIKYLASGKFGSTFIVKNNKDQSFLLKQIIKKHKLTNKNNKGNNNNKSNKNNKGKTNKGNKTLNKRKHDPHLAEIEILKYLGKDPNNIFTTYAIPNSSWSNNSYDYVLIKYISSMGVQSFNGVDNLTLNYFLESNPELLDTSMSISGSQVSVKNLLIVGLSNCVSYLRSKLIVHRDIKPANIMIQPQFNYRPVLVDFGFACSNNSEIPKISYSINDCILKNSATLLYMRPELLISHKQKLVICEDIGYLNFGFLADSWSLGCIIYQILNQGKHYKYRLNDRVNQLLGEEANIIAGENEIPSKTRTKILKEMFLTVVNNPYDNSPYIDANLIIGKYNIPKEVIDICIEEFNKILQEFSLHYLMNLNFLERDFDSYFKHLKY